MKLRNEDILDAIIEEINSGVEITQLIEKYPGITDEIKEYALLAKDIINIPKPELTEPAIEKLLTKIKRQAEISNDSKSFARQISAPIFWRRLVPVFSALILVLLAGWAGLLFSQQSIPGDFLYPVKIAAERIQYALTLQINDKAELHVKFAGNRTSELWKRFLEHNIFDPVLLAQMQKETAEAFQLKNNIAQDHTPALTSRIDDVNHQQIQVLTRIKPLAFPGDTAIINQAIDRCCELDKCVHNNNNNN